VITAGSVKICSLRKPVHAEWAVEARADLFGLIFVEHAWRRISPAEAREIVRESQRLRGTHPLRSVGVFVRSPADEVNRVADQVALDLVQLNARDLPDNLDSIERPIIAVLRPDRGADPTAVSEQVQALHAGGDRVAAVLLDAPSASGNGGLGELSDWNLAQAVALRSSIGLAGGLNPENIGAAIAQVAPHFVDVSSGVETDREKDRRKIITFVRNARSTFADSSIRQMDFAPFG
jgi:indole-3-glycerol phosphate synthase/phosphoribosylanthranilate isomerase